MSDDLRQTWTARAGLNYHFANPISDPSWDTNLSTIEQLGIPGLEGDVWRVRLHGTPNGVREAALKVYKAKFDMEDDLMDKIEISQRTNTPLNDLVPRQVRSFATEALFDFEHPNFNRPYAFGVCGKRNAVLMPYIPGDNLADYIRNNPSLNEETRLKLCGELCRAVAALNQAGYIHNDLKPENIMVRTEGPGAPSVHVIDMGLACKQDDLAKLYPGSEQPRIGTRGYWAPEIYHLGAIGASSASDAWSLGCTLFFILTSFELMDGVLDKKSEQSQNELYESLATKENLNLPMISLERMIRSGISNQDIATALGQLLTPLRKHRNLASGALLAMAALCDNGGISTRHSEASPSPPPRSPVEEGVTEGGYSAERRGAPRSTDFVKIILTPDVGVRQFILVKEGRDNFARHQHLPMISTSHTKLIQFSFDGVTVYAVARDDLGELLIDGKPWNGMAPIYDGSLISIDGFEIGVEIR